MTIDHTHQLGMLLEPLVRSLPDGSEVTVLGIDGETLATFPAGPQSAVAESADGMERASLRRRLRVGDLEELVCSFDVPPQCNGTMRSLIEVAVDASVERLRLEVDMESMQYKTLSMMEQQAVIVEVLPQLAGTVEEEGIIAKTLAEARRAGGFQSATFLRSEGGLLRPELRVDAAGSEATALDDGTFAPIPIEGQDDLAALLSGGATLFESPGPNARNPAPPAALAPFADRVAIVAPVRYGEGSQQETLGLVVASGIASVSYLDDDRELGSDETKAIESFSSILGAVLGARESAKLASELANAQEIQQLILPSCPAKVEGFDIAGASLPSGFVGGDYYDFIRMADGRTFVVVADVSGHNLASGMIMVEARASLRALTGDASDPIALFDKFAAAIHPDLSTMERFITAVGLAVRPGSGTVDLVNAGHNDTLVWRKSTGEIERVVSDDTVLGFMAGARHEPGTIELEPGDVVLAFTDGITEAMGPDEEMFGEDRLEEVLCSVATRSAEEILSGLLDAVRSFQTEDRFEDDVTAVVLAYRG